MQKRAKINIEIANCLNELSDTTICDTYGNIQNNADIRHIIIGRWYYGLFLLAKDKLIAHRKANNSCRIKKQCKYRNATKCIAKDKEFHHKSNFNSKIVSIWECIASIYPKKDQKTIKEGFQLACLREKFEYSGLDCLDNEMQEAKDYFQGVIHAIERK